jgi:hypothetical protein
MDPVEVAATPCNEVVEEESSLSQFLAEFNASLDALSLALQKVGEQCQT